MESEELVQYIKNLTYVVLRNTAKCKLDSTNISRDEAYFEIATLPTNLVKSVCDEHNSHLWENTAIPEKNIPLAFMTIKAIVEKEKSAFSSALNMAGKVANPLWASMKDQVINGVLGDNTDKASKLVATSGQQIALAIFSELHNQGISLEDIKSNITDFYLSEIGLSPKQEHMDELDDQILTQELKNSATELAKDGLEEASKVAKKVTGKAKGMFNDFFS